MDLPEKKNVSKHDAQEKAAGLEGIDGIHRDPVGVDEYAQGRNKGKTQHGQQSSAVRASAVDQKNDDSNDCDEIIDNVNIGKNAEQRPPRVTGGSIADLPEKSGTEHGQDYQCQVKEPGNGKEHVPLSLRDEAARKVLREQKPDIGKCDVDQIKQKIEQNKKAPVKVHGRIDDDPQTVHGDVKETGPDQDQRNSAVITVFQFAVHVEQH